MNEYFVFLYGVLADKSIITRLLKRLPDSSSHSIEDYEIQKDSEYGFESLFHKQGVKTDGILCVLNENDIKILDRFNEIYRRITINDMFVYFVKPEYLRDK